MSEGVHVGLRPRRLPRLIRVSSVPGHSSGFGRSSKPRRRSPAVTGRRCPRDRSAASRSRKPAGTAGITGERVANRAPNPEDARMRLCLFEDRGARDLEPLTQTRPAFDLICGPSTLAEQLIAHFPGAEVGLIVRPELA